MQYFTAGAASAVLARYFVRPHLPSPKDEATRPSSTTFLSSWAVVSICVCQCGFWCKRIFNIWKWRDASEAAVSSIFLKADSKTDSKGDSNSFIRRPLLRTMTSTFAHDVSTFLHHDIYMGLTMVSSTFANDVRMLMLSGVFWCVLPGMVWPITRWFRRLWAGTWITIRWKAKSRRS